MSDTVVPLEPPAALRQRVENLIGARRYEDALPWAGRAIASDPDNARSHCLLALALLHLSRYREALRAAETAIKQDPAEEWAHRLRSAILVRLGKKQAALAAAREAARLAPDLPEALYILCIAELARGHLSAAGAAAGRLAGIAPDRAVAHEARGYTALAGRRWGEAEACFRRALALDAESVEALNGLGASLFRQGKRLEAIDRFHDAARLDPAGGTGKHNLQAALRWHLRPFSLFAASVAIYHIWRIWHGAVPALGPAAVVAAAACIAGMLWLRRERVQALPAQIAFLARHERQWAPSPGGRFVKILTGVVLAGLALNFANYSHWVASQWYELALLFGTLITMALWLA